MRMIIPSRLPGGFFLPAAGAMRATTLSPSMASRRPLGEIYTSDLPALSGMTNPKPCGWACNVPVSSSIFSGRPNRFPRVLMTSPFRTSSFSTCLILRRASGFSLSCRISSLRSMGFPILLLIKSASFLGEWSMVVNFRKAVGGPLSVLWVSAIDPRSKQLLHSEKLSRRFRDRYEPFFDLRLGLDQPARFVREPAGNAEFLSRRGGRPELYRDLGGHGRNAETERQLCHGLVEEGGQDSAVHDPFISLMRRGWRERRAYGPCGFVDLKNDLQTGRILCAADVTALVIAKLFHRCDQERIRPWQKSFPRLYLITYVSI